MTDTRTYYLIATVDSPRLFLWESAFVNDWTIADKFSSYESAECKILSLSCPENYRIVTCTATVEL